ncbi:MAG: SPW repeat protein [Bacteroidetes bacterium]|nr:SPW repeat protein [Bacteroidota bacterium]HET6245699.1 SPW repeat protein [Bacteroidia bacterium]
MKVISSKAHGVMDYIIGIALVAAPWLFQFARGGAETWVPVILGIVVIVMALFTDYELGVFKITPMSTHLWIDGVLGVFLLLSPWIFGFWGFVLWPHVIVGILMAGVSLMTETTTVHIRVT